jgi:hypothetical protein
MNWKDNKTEHVLSDSAGAVLGRVTKRGCCWYATIGNQPASAARFSRIEDAKRIVEKLVGN